MHENAEMEKVQDGEGVKGGMCRPEEVHIARHRNIAQGEQGERKLQNLSSCTLSLLTENQFHAEESTMIRSRCRAVHNRVDVREAGLIHMENDIRNWILVVLLDIFDEPV